MVHLGLTAAVLPPESRGEQERRGVGVQYTMTRFHDNVCMADLAVASLVEMLPQLIVMDGGFVCYGKAV